jgi:phosphoglycolate phosphatase
MSATASSDSRAVSAVILDLDGTLADSLADIGHSMNSVLASRGMPVHSLSAYQLMVGDGLAQLVERALPAEARAESGAAIDEFRREYAENLLDHTRAYDGILDMLDALSARGFALAVLSNKPHALTVRVVDALFGSTQFVSVLGQRDGVPRKPDPAGALEIAEHIGVEPARCAFVGDTAVDIETARRAGMIAVGVLWGFRGKDELSAAGARHILAHPSDLLALV